MASFEVKSTLTGIHSRSEDTVKVSRDFDRLRASKEELDSTFERDIKNLVMLQKEAGITEISDGQLKWQDFLRPFSDGLGGLKGGADLSRWYDTNSFYRKPSVVKNLKLRDANLLSDYISTKALDQLKGEEKKKISILGPFTLASLVEDEYYDSKKELVLNFARVLRKLLKQLSEQGFSSVQINEPSLVYRYGESALTSKKMLKAFLSAYEDYLSSPPFEVILHTYFGDSSKILEKLVRLKGVSAIGVDFTQTSLDSVAGVSFGEKSLACGCVDGRNSLVESPDWIANFCMDAVKTLKPNGLVILPSSELKYLPRSYADEKIKSIGKATQIVRAKLG